MARRRETPSLGPLEARVMGAVWALGTASVRDVWERLGGEAEAAYTTVMTVMTRLTEKGLLKRKLRGNAYVYRPRMTKQAYEQAVSRARVRGLIDQYGDAAIAAFAKEVERIDPERARRLAEMIRGRQGR